MSIDLKGWGDEVPQFVRLLAIEAELTNMTKASQRIGMSRTAVSLILAIRLLAMNPVHNLLTISPEAAERLLDSHQLRRCHHSNSAGSTRHTAQFQGVTLQWRTPSARRGQRNGKPTPCTNKEFHHEHPQRNPRWLSQGRAASVTTGICQVWHQSVASGLTPQRLANILQAAAEGSTHDYLTLAEEMEERDLHYSSVLGTRKLAVSGLNIRIEAATDEAEDVRRADALSELVTSPDFGELQADLTDALGKGYAVSEIILDRSGKTWNPERFEARDPRLFQFDRQTGRELRLLDDDNSIDGIPLEPYKFIVHLPRIRSRLPIRGGLARLGAVGYMRKAWAWKDWMGFADIFGMPMRVGRYGPGATKDDIQTLMSAVANLGSDAAAVIPDSMRIDFNQAANVAGAGDFFKGLAEWWDKQISKAVIGQTMSSDDGSSMAQAKVHNEVRLDLLQADAKAESNTLNRHFVRPWCDLNFAPGRAYPKLIIDVPQPEDTKLLVDALTALVPLGLRVEQSVIRDRLNIPEPAKDALLLGIPAAMVPLTLGQATNREQGSPLPGVEPDIIDNQARTMELAAGEHLDDMIGQIEQLLNEVGSLEEFRDRLIEIYPMMTTTQLAVVITDGLAAANLAGRFDIRFNL